MIISRLIGGLGNQLFQYAFGRYLAHINHTNLKLDITGFETYKLHYYSLSNFNIIEEFATPEDINKIKPLTGSLIQKASYHVKRILGSNRFVEEKGLEFSKEVMECHNNSYLQGYWQSEKYFKPIEKIIREEFIIRTTPSGKDKEIADQINGTMSVSLHVRRADYITNPETNKIYGSIGLEYYNKSLEFLSARVTNPHLFIFSDDFDWVKKFLDTDYPVTYVDHNDHRKNYEDLRLMSLCKHNIIPNSTFSWWGAWLNQHPDKLVIAPEKWFITSKFDSRDIIPDEWIKL
jgi:hypothetical protein